MHFRRLYDSAAASALAFTPPVPLERAVEDAAALLARNRVRDHAYIRPTLYHQGTGSVCLGPALGGGCHLAMYVQRWESYLPSRGLNCTISPIRKSLSPHARFKTCGNYVFNIEAKLEARARGFDEAVMLDQNGLVAEGTSENLVVQFKNGDLATPRLAGRPILPGITLRILMEKIAPELGLEIREANIVPEFLFDDAVGFVMTGTAAEVAYVSLLASHRRRLQEGKCWDVRRYSEHPPEKLAKLIEGYKLLAAGQAFHEFLTFVDA